jgi:hypothetical protein
MSIKLTIEFSDQGNGGVGVLVHTDEFDPRQQSRHVGATWIGVCTAINEYMRRTGCPDFDCLKAHSVS